MEGLIYVGMFVGIIHILLGLNKMAYLLDVSSYRCKTCGEIATKKLIYSYPSTDVAYYCKPHAKEALRKENSPLIYSQFSHGKDNQLSL